MFLDLFKKERYPIRLETVRAAKNVLYSAMSSDLEMLNGYYGIFPQGSAGELMQDVKQLLGSEIAEEFRLAFYDPTDPKRVYLERSYCPSNGKKGQEYFPTIRKRPLPRPYEFDIYVYFSDRFLALAKREQTRLLGGFQFKWFSFAGGGNGGSAGIVPLKPGTEEPAAEASFKPETPDYEQYLQSNESVINDEASAFPDGYDVTQAASDGSGQQVVLDEALPSPVETSEKKPRRPLLSTPPSAEDATLMKQFASDNNLLIAAYTDSRKLIERFTRLSAYLGLIPLQWTFTDGFREIGDKYAGRYMISDNYLLNAKLTPLEALSVIRNECQSHTLYLLEDFHYYLKRENMSGQDFAELISIMKSMPEVLKRQNSFLVVLAPTLDLPAEIAPIFGIIRDEVAGRRLHFLERFGRDLTEQAEEKRIKPIVGRDREIYSCLKVLSQMEANNPILIGKAGVGKTAVVEGLAHLIVKKEVPAMFREKRIIALNLNAMVSGTKYRGEFETRIEGLVDEVKANVGKIIVFIDEIHTLLGMGATEGSTGAENILKPSLARGEFPCIGATTSEEYLRYIEPDRALARRFQTVNVPEPDMPQSIDILKGIKGVYEKHYGLRITDQALAACVEMAAHYLPTQCFPGKAIRMLDGVCASVSLAGKDSVDEKSVAEEFNRL